MLSAPHALPELCTVRQHKRYRKQIIQHGVPVQFLATQRFEINSCTVNDQKLCAYKQAVDLTGTDIG